MKYLVVILLFFCTFGKLRSQEIEGQWNTDYEDAIVQIYKEGNEYKGQTIWYKTENGTIIRNELNASDGRANRKDFSLPILFGFKKNKNQWKGGYFYFPAENKKYAAKIWLVDGKLKVRIFMGLFYNTFTWTRNN